MNILPPPVPFTPQRVLNLVGGMILGLMFFAFMLSFCGVAHADGYYDGTNPGYNDLSPDYVLIIRINAGITTAHFEDEQACLNAAQAVSTELGIAGYQLPIALCAAEQSE